MGSGSKKDKKDKKENIFAAGIVGIVLILLIVSGIYECPAKAILGIPCPLCGMSHAFICLLHKDIEGAFYYHPLWPVMAVILIVLILLSLRIIKISNKCMKILGIMVGIIFVGCYALRLILHSDVVTDGIFESGLTYFIKTILT